MRGTVSRWRRERGFGFVQPDGAGPLLTSAADIFCHASDIQAEREYQYLLPGDRVEFKLGTQKDGRQKAVAIRVIDEVEE